jgi:hypothetical protein
MRIVNSNIPLHIAVKARANKKCGRFSVGEGDEEEAFQEPKELTSHNNVKISTIYQTYNSNRISNSASSPNISMVVQYGEHMLNDLLQLQTNFLFGEVDKDILESMKNTVKELNPSTENPELNDIIQNIRVRLAVEIQKQENQRNFF